MLPLPIPFVPILGLWLHRTGAIGGVYIVELVLFSAQGGAPCLHEVEDLAVCGWPNMFVYNSRILNAKIRAFLGEQEEAAG